VISAGRYSSTRRIPGANASKKILLLDQDLALSVMLFARSGKWKKLRSKCDSSGETVVWYMGKQRAREVEEI